MVVKAAAVLAACTLWLVFVIQCWERGVSVPHGTYLDRINALLSDTYNKAAVNTYLCLSGFLFLAFYLTVLLPDILKPLLDGQPRRRLVFRIAVIALLCFGALCMVTGCLYGRTDSFARGLYRGQNGNLAGILRDINIYLTPVSLVLMFFTWLIPRVVLGLRDIAKNGLKLSAAGRTVLFYALLVLIAFLVTGVSALLLAVLRPFSSSAVYMVTIFCKNEAQSDAAFFSTVLLASTIEEFAFRGLIQKHLKRTMPAGIALIITAVFFGLWHRNLGQFVYTFFCAVVWGVIYNASGKIRHTICMHIMQNLFAVMAYSVSSQAVLGKLTVLPAMREGLISLAPVPAVLVILLFCFLIFIIVEIELYLINGKQNFVIRAAGRLRKKRPAAK